MTEPIPPAEYPAAPSYPTTPSQPPQAPSYPPTASYPQVEPNPPTAPTAAYPQYSQPQYSQDPTFPQQSGYYPAPGGFPGTMPPPPKPSRLWLWLTLGAVAIVLLAAGIGITALVVASHPSGSTTSAVAASATPSVSAVSTPAATTGAGSPDIHLTQPTTLNGEKINTDAALTSVVSGMSTQLKGLMPTATDTVQGFYGSPTTKSLTMLVAIAAPDDSPAAYLSAAMTGLKTSLNMTGTKTVNPGPLGGSAQCGDGHAGGQTIAVCAWTDTGSFGVIIFYYKHASAAYSAFLTARGQVEKVG